MELINVNNLRALALYVKRNKRMNVETENNIKNIESFVKEGVNFWFSSKNHIRCPFPNEIREELIKLTTSSFNAWVNELEESEKNKITESEFVEMLEVIIFNEAINLVDDEDQQITITYPFMPRIGDFVNDLNYGKGKIVNRKINSTKENKKLMEVSVLSETTSETWKTEFELPA